MPSADSVPRGAAGAFVLLLCAIVPFVMLAISYEVVARYFFHAVPLWVNDITGYLLLALTFLGGAYVMAREGHTRVDILVEHTRPRIRRVLGVVNAILVLIVAIALSIASAYTIWDAYQRNVAMVGIVEVPRYVVLMPILAGCVLLVFERLLRLRSMLRSVRAAPAKTRS